MIQDAELRGIRLRSETTLEGWPANAWCHLCDPVQSFRNIAELQEHMKDHRRSQRPGRVIPQCGREQRA